MRTVNVTELLYGNSPRELIVAASIAGGTLLLVWVIRTLARWKLRNAHLTATEVDDFFLDVANRTKLFLLVLPVVFLGARALTVPREAGRLLRVGAALTFVAQTALWASGVVDFWLRRYRRMRVETDPAAVMTINAFRVAALSAVWILAALAALDNLGFNITTLIAGLGVGGVAVALATQNILGDLFASLSIVIDKPFVIGDAIGVDGLSGTVQHIGLKTTRIRSLAGEELIFANGDLLKSRIHNYKRMTERRGVLHVGVIYQTPVEQLQRIPTLLRASIERQRDARFERAHFVSLGESALEFEAVYFVTSAEYGTFADVREAVNLDVVRTFQQERIEFAYPTRMVLSAKS